MKLVFCGTPRFAVPTLEALVVAGHEVALVLSQPDRPVGRAAEIVPTLVKAAALGHGILVEQPERIRDNEELRAQLKALAPDAMVVVAYGRILPQWMLDLPRYGCINGHASLLPRWRGAAPIQWAIAAGDRETGVTTMQLDAGLDTGAMLLQRAVPVTAEMTAPEMFEVLSVIGAELMVETLAGLEAGRVIGELQDDSLATHARILTREDGRIDWSRTAPEIDARFRGFQPWPGAFTELRGKKLIVHAMRVDGAACDGAPGEIVGASASLRICCGGGPSLLLDEVQLEGKRRISADEFLRGFQVKAGERLG